MRPILFGTLGAILLSGLVGSGPALAHDSLSLDQKIWGVMTVWHEVKTGFVFRDQLADWDERVRDVVPLALAAPDMSSYYDVLTRLVATLHNGHTRIVTPEHLWNTIGIPPLEIEWIDGQFLVSRVGERQDVRNQGIWPGLEITAVDGVPVSEYFETHVLSKLCFSTEQQAHAAGLFHLLEGPVGSVVTLDVAGTDGRSRRVSVSRSSRQDDGSYFYWRVNNTRPVMEMRRLRGSVWYCRLSTFAVDAADLEKECLDGLRRAEAQAMSGLIVDIRFNGGGNDAAAFAVLRRLLSQPAPMPLWKSRQYVPAWRAWGQEEGWHIGNADTLSPAEDFQYRGPLALLIGPNTTSAAEDFAVILHAARRATLIGQRSAGDTGQILSVVLPAGGYLWVCTKWDSYPDGREFVGVGIEPDIVVSPTRQDVARGRDPALERALEILGRGK